MRIISANLNGIRSAASKGFYEWLACQQADIVCLQETRVQVEHLSAEIFKPEHYHCYFTHAEKKGYSGVAIYSKQKPDHVSTQLHFDVADREGRYIQADFGTLSVASIYLPSGSSGEERQKLKFNFMDHYEKILKRQSDDGRSYIICGDWNIVHKEIDIKNFKSNQKNSGCLPEEREWLDHVFTKLHFVDAFRVLNKEPDQYTWWSNRGRARENNVGWRIDYQIITPDLAAAVSNVTIYKDKKFSDHAPVVIDYAI